METQEIKDEWLRAGEMKPPPDTSREQAAFERERARLVRDHLGKIAVVRFDEVVGVYDDFNVATIEAHKRFGWGQMIFIEITERDEPVYIANVDVNHPSVRRID